MANQTYFNGDFWQCATATNVGESPTTTPAKWRRILIPKTFRRVLAKLTYANILELDGQTDKAAVHRSAGEGTLEDQVREEANRETCDNPAHGNIHAPQANQSIPAQVIIEDAERLMRWDLTELEESQIEDARNAFSMALQQLWEAWWWPSLMVFEELTLRPVFDFVNQSHVYAPVTSALVPGGNDPEVYFPPNKKYYQALAPTLGYFEPPATLVNGAYVTNDLFWAESKRCYPGADYLDGTIYSPATIVRNPKDARFYQKLGGLTATSAGTPETNVSFQLVTQNLTLGFTEYDPMVSGALGRVFIVRNEALAGTLGYNWSIYAYNPNPGIQTYLYHASAPGVTAAENVTNWQSGDVVAGNAFVGVQPGPTLTAQGAPPAVATLDAAPFWGRLTPWIPSLTYPRPVRLVTREDPRFTHNPCHYSFHPLANGILIPDLLCGTVWISARRVTPVVTGNTFDPLATYEATPQDELVYDS